MISVIVPVLNEEDNIVPLLKEIDQTSRVIPISEVIYIDDGSTDQSFNVLCSLRDQYPMLRIIKHDRRSGQSAALWTGVKAASNELVVTLDGDGQNNPVDIALLYENYNRHGKINPALMVIGERKKRNDNMIRRLSSRFANNVRAIMLKDKTKDTGCSLKLFRRKDYLALPYFNHMHRYLPALMMRDHVKIIHVGVSHRPRRHGVSKYGTLDRLLVGICDLFGVWWLQRRPNPHPHIFEELN